MPVDPTPRPAGPARPRLPWMAGLAAFVLAALSALAVPMMGLPDEPAHAVHAAAVVRGELVGQDAVRTDPDSGWTRTETAVTVPSAYAALPGLPVCFAFEPGVPASCAPAVPGDAGAPTTAVTTVGTYAPPWYAAVGWPSLALPPHAALVAMRLLAAALFASLVGVAVGGAVRAGGKRVALVGVLLALPPVAVHLGGGINPSGTEIAGAVALWTTSAALVRGATDRGDLVRWAVAGVLVAVTRPLGPALAVGIPLATALVLAPRTSAAPWRAPGVLRTGATLVVVAIGALAWSLWRGTLSAFSGFPAPEATGLTAVRRSLALVPERLTEMVGVLGWSDVALPRLVVLGWLVAVAVLVIIALRVADRRATRGWLVLLALVALVLPVAADVRSAPSIGFVWQGRYTLPVAAGLPVLSGLVLDTVDRRPAWVPTATHVIAVLAVVGHATAFLSVLVRFRVGRGGGVVDALGRSGGPVEVSGWVVMTGLVVGLAGLGALAWWSDPARGEPHRRG